MIFPLTCIAFLLKTPKEFVVLVWFRIHLEYCSLQIRKASRDGEFLGKRWGDVQAARRVVHLRIKGHLQVIEDSTINSSTAKPLDARLSRTRTI